MFPFRRFLKCTVVYLFVSKAAFCFDISLVDANEFVPEINKVERRVRFVDMVGCIFKDLYAPLSCKELLYDFNWLEEVQNTKKIVSSDNCSMENFHRALVRLLFKLRDPHCNVVSFLPYSFSVLPFSVIWVDDCIFIKSVDIICASEIRSGQRILQIDGQDALEFCNDRLEDFFGCESCSYPGWSKDFVAQSITNSGVPWGGCQQFNSIELLIEGTDGANSYEVSIEWIEKPDMFSVETYSGAEPLNSAESGLWNNSDLLSGLPKFLSSGLRILSSPSLSDLLTPINNGKDFVPVKIRAYEFGNVGELRNYELGSPVSFIPYLGEVTWSSRSDKSASIEAYIAVADGFTLGYLRLGDFSTWKMEELDSYLTKMEESVDILVLDLMRNRGGKGGRALALASRFAKEPLQTHPEIIKVSPALCEMVRSLDKEVIKRGGLSSDMSDYDACFGTFEAFRISSKNVSVIRDFCSQVSDAVSDEKTVIFPAYWLGIKELRPLNLFSKPLLILSDRSTMSSAESFLTIMVGNRDKRDSVILGTNSAGVGGGADTVSVPNLNAVSSISYSWTMVISSVTGCPIEDIGVPADEPYVVGKKDIKEKFVPLKNKILETCSKILFPKTIDIYVEDEDFE